MDRISAALSGPRTPYCMLGCAQNTPATFGGAGFLGRAPEGTRICVWAVWARRQHELLCSTHSAPQRRAWDREHHHLARCRTLQQLSPRTKSWASSILTRYILPAKSGTHHWAIPSNFAESPTFRIVRERTVSRGQQEGRVRLRHQLPGHVMHHPVCRQTWS
jgi:hypothetical protein